VGVGLPVKLLINAYLLDATAPEAAEGPRDGRVLLRGLTARMEGLAVFRTRCEAVKKRQRAKTGSGMIARQLWRVRRLRKKPLLGRAAIVCD
jgi:hypothetical protein